MNKPASTATQFPRTSPERIDAIRRDMISGRFYDHEICKRHHVSSRVLTVLRKDMKEQAPVNHSALYIVRADAVGWRHKPIVDTNVYEAAKLFVRRRMKRRGYHSAKMHISLGFRDRRTSYGAETAEVDAVTVLPDGAEFRDTFGLHWRKVSGLVPVPGTEGRKEMNAGGAR